MLVLSWLPPCPTLGAGHLAQHLPAVHAVDPLAAFSPQLQRSASLAVLQLKSSFRGFIDRLHPWLLSAGTKKPCAALECSSTAQGSLLATGLCFYLVRL